MFCWYCVGWVKWRGYCEWGILCEVGILELVLCDAIIVCGGYCLWWVVCGMGSVLGGHCLRLGILWGDHQPTLWLYGY